MAKRIPQSARYELLKGDSIVAEIKEKKELSLAEYERLCAEACLAFTSSGSRETDEETLMFKICRNVYSFLEENFKTFFPIVDAPNLRAYEWKLNQLVEQRRSESFDTLETPWKYIKANTRLRKDSSWRHEGMTTAEMRLFRLALVLMMLKRKEEEDRLGEVILGLERSTYPCPNQNVPFAMASNEQQEISGS